MKNLSKLFCLILCVTILLSLIGCSNQGNGISLWYDFNAVYKSVSDGKVADNSKYSLIWDSQNGCVALYDKIHDTYYSNVPNNAKENTTQPIVYSPIVVRYIESDTLNTSNVSAYAHSIKSKDFSAEKISNGIKVTYYFKKIGVSVPVNYILREDSLQVMIDPAEIAEDVNYCYSIDLMPFSCSVLNTDTANDSYLFVPSGSGALIYPKILGESITSIISNEVYGRDDVTQDDSSTETENIYLPVYGAKNGNNAVCAIIESASESSTITTNVGSSTYAYSSVYSSFYIRGSEVYTTTLMGELASKKTLFCKEKTTEKISVGFYPLQDEDASYVGMAKVYQNYLLKNKNLKKGNQDTQLNLNYIGGVMSKSFFAGIPYDKLTVLTEFTDVKDSLKEITDSYNGQINIKLSGFGATGCDINEIGGAFKYNKDFGDIKVLSEFVDSGKVNTFFNFDILHFSESGSGVSTFNDVALSAVGRKNPKRHYTVALHETDWLDSNFWVVSREKLNSLANKAIDKSVKWKLNGLSLDTLTYRTYSDYSSKEFYAKAGFDNQVSNIVKNANKEGLKFASTGGNSFAAVLSDHVFNAPTKSSMYNIFDVDVPFYQLVLKGYVSLSVYPINLSADADTAFLKAVETGTGLGYTLISSHDTDVFNTKQNIFYASVYDDTKQMIFEQMDSYEVLFNKIANVSIKDFEIKDSLHITTFENGIKVYTNFSSESLETEFGKVEAKNFIYGEVQ